RPGIGEEGENLVGPRGIGLAPRIGTETQIDAALVAHIEAVIGPEHDHRDVRLFAGRKALDRRQPLGPAVHQRGAGMTAVEDAIARVFDQDALQPAGETLRLAIAKDRDRRPVNRLIGTRGAAEQAKEKKKDGGSHDRPPDNAKTTASAHGAVPPATSTQLAVEYCSVGAGDA